MGVVFNKCAAQEAEIDAEAGIFINQVFAGDRLAVRRVGYTSRAERYSELLSNVGYGAIHERNENVPAVLLDMQVVEPDVGPAERQFAEFGDAVERRSRFDEDVEPGPASDHLQGVTCFGNGPDHRQEDLIGPRAQRELDLLISMLGREAVDPANQFACRCNFPHTAQIFISIIIDLRVEILLPELLSLVLPIDDDTVHTR